MIAYTMDDLIVHTSGEYLTHQLPKNYSNMDEVKFWRYLETHVPEAFEDIPTYEIWDMIQHSADSLKTFLEQKPEIMVIET